MSQRSTLLLEHHLKELRLPSFHREYGKMAAQCAAGNVDHPEYLLRLAELELIDFDEWTEVFGREQTRTMGCWRPWRTGMRST